ncbi:MAG: cytochrome c oxidase subunit II [Alphaproteobacteria bacterium]|nr:cytochrome c oxidase subunit II [Alphaproteobacteria bacterium]
MIKNKIAPALSVFFTALFFVFPVLAGEPVDWGLGFQPAASSSAERIHEFHDLLLIIIAGISGFVLLLLVYVVLRYNRFANKNPSKVTHNVLLEIIWTIIPIVILIVIVLPSFKLLYQNDKIPEPEMTIKVVGFQWGWTYEYPDHAGITFDSYMVPDEDIGPGQKRLLSTDNVVVLPVDTNIAVLVTARDVIHSWTIPAFGVKVDAIPLRTNEIWFRIDRPGTYYGQCSEICGRGHSFMPIEVRAVPKEEFEAWVEKAKEEFASVEDDSEATVKFAAVAQ